MPSLTAALRSPLLHFLVLGSILFWIGDLRREPDHHRIVIGPQLSEKIIASYVGQYGAPPSQDQLDYLVERFIREEILYREGIALGLDRDDEIIRRRIVQKVEFLREDIDTTTTPEAVDLERYFDQHKQRYTTPETVSFTHIYYADEGGDAEQRARRTLQLLNARPLPRAPELGDSFAHGYDYALLDSTAATRLFGTTELSQAIFQAPLQRWAGPFRSGYGWHLIQVQARYPAQLPPLAEVHAAVLADYRKDIRRRENADAFTRLRAQYTIVRADDSHD